MPGWLHNTLWSQKLIDQFLDLVEGVDYINFHNKKSKSQPF